MRPTALILALALAGASLTAADTAAPAAKPESKPADAKPIEVKMTDPKSDGDLRKQASYLVGIRIKAMVDRAVGDGDLDRDEIMRGLQDAVAGKATEPSQAEQQEVFQKYDAQLQAKRAKEGEARSDENKTWLAEHAKKPGVQSTASGLQYEVVAKGKDGGKQPQATSKVRVNYVGTKRDGTVFDASDKHGGPAEFALNQVIKGWTEGLQLMREGDKYRFTIPADLAYGQNAPPTIGANQILTFEVELLAVLSDAK